MTGELILRPRGLPVSRGFGRELRQVNASGYLATVQDQQLAARAAQRITTAVQLAKQAEVGFAEVFDLGTCLGRDKPGLEMGCRYLEERMLLGIGNVISVCLGAPLS